jgi:hypothetical protein
VPRKSEPAHELAFFTTFPCKSAMPLNRKVVCLNKLHNFSIGRFEVFSEILENVPKILGWQEG